MSMIIPNSYLNPNVATSKAYSNKTNSTQAPFSTELSLSPEEEMAIFKKEFYNELSEIKTHSTIANVAIHISEDAFVKMKEDPQYKEEIINLLKRDLGSSHAPRTCSLLLTIGSSLSQYRGDSWPIIADSEFHVRSQNSFYKKTNINKDKYKEILEEYIQKTFQEKQYQKKMLEKRANQRVLKLYYEEREYE